LKKLYKLHKASANILNAERKAAKEAKK